MKLAALLLTLLLANAACRSKKADPTPATSTAAPAASAPVTPVAAPEREPPELPTESDYEQEASEQITGANLERELDALEKELVGP